MIPKLFASTETAFVSEGLGRLPNATRCEVTEERNGIYELVLEYPVIPGDEMLNNIQVGCFIGATHDDDDQDIQPFQIYKVSAPIRGVVTVNAWHISYALNYIPVMPFTANSCADVLSGIPTNSMKTNPFTFWTDKTTTGEFIMKQPMAARALLGGTQGSVLDTYGSGEYEFDKYNVKLWTNRGADNGVEIRYGKNLIALDYVLNGADVFNAVAPFWSNDTTTVYLDHLVVKSGETAQNAIPLDLSSEFETEPTSAQLEAAAQAYIDASGNYSLKENITVDFYPIWQTEEYKYDERVKLCDTVTVIFGGYNIKAKAKVVKVIYDTLRDRYKSIELGSPKTTFAQEITQIVSDNIMGDVGSLVKRTAADAIPDASTTERGLVNTGAQTFGGDKTVDGTLTGKEFLGIQYDGVSDEAPKVKIKDFDGAHAGDMIMAVSNVSAIGKRRARTFRWRQFGINTTTGAKQSYFESYTLPTGPINLTENHAYNIWTTKAIPEPPTAAGTYTLKATRTSGGVTYSWVL